MPTISGTFIRAPMSLPGSPAWSATRAYAPETRASARRTASPMSSVYSSSTRWASASVSVSDASR